MKSKRNRIIFLLTIALLLGSCTGIKKENTHGAINKVTEVSGLEKQPFYFHVKRIMETLDILGTPVSKEDKKALLDLMSQDGEIGAVQSILEKYTLFNVHINPESRVKVKEGNAEPALIQGGWKTFLVKIENEAGITAKLEVESDQAKTPYNGGRIQGMGSEGMGDKVSPSDIKDRWLDIELYTNNPMKKNLSGLEVEYFIIQLYSRDIGKRAAKIAFNCGQGTQDIGFRNEVDILFQCAPSQKVVFDILDENQNPTMASLIIRDPQGHIYPSQAKRLAPDFFFQKQIYRHHSESIHLPTGKYTVEYGRGPEYDTKTKEIEVHNGSNQELKIRLERWIDPQKLGWYSGDHHIHAAGCSHYTSPSDGVNPEDMFRHLLGEGVNVGSVLTWGPGYDHQKQFFEGKENELSNDKNIIRYDMEISGFPSGHAGHVVLLRLKDQHYPMAKGIEDWPTYTLPVLRWAKQQGAITGYAHSGLGLEVVSNDLPNYEMPRFDGIGANEYIVAVTHNLVDFISTMDTPPVWELNIWYHTLNNGFRTKISGETDFPCMSDTKVAHGRSYVKLEGDLSYNKWSEGLKLGRSYTSEGKSHLFDFKVNDLELGTNNSELKLDKPSNVKIKAKVSALLNETINPHIKPLNTQGEYWFQRPYWNIERGRIGSTRTVAVELIVNGEVVDKKAIEANGSLQDISFDTYVSKSSWIALRVESSSHSNPIFVLVDNKPIRANKKSAEWCLKAVDVCWESKKGNMNEADRAKARKDYDYAKKVYEDILKEYQ